MCSWGGGVRESIVYVASCPDHPLISNSKFNNLHFSTLTPGPGQLVVNCSLPHSPLSNSHLKIYPGQILTHLQVLLKNDHLNEVFPTWLDVRFWVSRALPNRFITTNWPNSLLNPKRQVPYFVHFCILITEYGVCLTVGVIHPLNI